MTDEAQATVDEIVNLATDKIVDWGQNCPLGIIGTADAVAAALAKWADLARIDAAVEATAEDGKSDLLRAIREAFR